MTRVFSKFIFLYVICIAILHTDLPEGDEITHAGNMQIQFLGICLIGIPVNKESSLTFLWVLCALSVAAFSS